RSSPECVMALSGYGADEMKRHVTGHHAKEGADVRRDRSTHPRLPGWGVTTWEAYEQAETLTLWVRRRREVRLAGAGPHRRPNDAIGSSSRNSTSRLRPPPRLQ